VARSRARLFSIDRVLDCVCTGWPPLDIRAFKEAISLLLRSPTGESLGYLNALSQSYILMQMLNIDPQSVSVQRKRVRESTALLDTDVVLTGIVDGLEEQGLVGSIVDLCDKLGVRCFTSDGSVTEIVHRIKASINLFEDLNRPNMIPADKQDLVSDIFLDQYFARLNDGTVRSFGEYIEPYYDPDNPAAHVARLIDSRLGIGGESLESLYLHRQDEKVDNLAETIGELRRKSHRFKDKNLYWKDAFQMVVVEQQNREALNNARLGRYYLVSSDRHILRAYLKHKNSFKVKPCVLPAHFLANLRAVPEAGAGEREFGDILRSEAMLRGTRRNYASIIGALSHLGIDALALPRMQLLELVEDMDRADFTRWLFALRGAGRVSDRVREQIVETLERLIQESTSRQIKARVIKDLHQLTKRKVEGLLDA